MENFPDQKEAEQTQNIVPVNFAISEIDRAQRFKHRSAILATRMERPVFMDSRHFSVGSTRSARAGGHEYDRTRRRHT